MKIKISPSVDPCVRIYFDKETYWVIKSYRVPARMVKFLDFVPSMFFDEIPSGRIKSDVYGITTEKKFHLGLCYRAEDISPW